MKKKHAFQHLQILLPYLTHRSFFVTWPLLKLALPHAHKGCKTTNSLVAITFARSVIYHDPFAGSTGSIGHSWRGRDPSGHYSGQTTSRRQGTQDL